MLITFTHYYLYHMHISILIINEIITLFLSLNNTCNTDSSAFIHPASLLQVCESRVVLKLVEIIESLLEIGIVALSLR